MTFEIRTVDRAEGWDSFVQSHPKGSVFHTSAMCRALNAAKDHQVLAICACDRQGEVRALLVAALVSTIGKLRKLAARSIMFAEPICTNDNVGATALSTLLKHHDQFMRQRCLFTEVRPLFSRGREHMEMLKCGYEPLSYWNYELDLTLPEQELWRGIDAKCRNDIRRTERRGVVIREAAFDELDTIYALLSESYSHSGIPLVDKTLFVSTFAEVPRDQIELHVAEYEGESIAAACNLIYSKRLVYWFAGIRRIRGIAANSCLVWEAMRRNHQRGIELFDFGGAGWLNEDYGPGKFKARFGGELVEHGRYRRVYNKWALRAAEKAYQWSRRILAPSGRNIRNKSA